MMADAMSMRARIDKASIEEHLLKTQPLELEVEKIIKQYSGDRSGNLGISTVVDEEEKNRWTEIVTELEAKDLNGELIQERIFNAFVDATANCELSFDFNRGDAVVMEPFILFKDKQGNFNFVALKYSPHGGHAEPISEKPIVIPKHMSTQITQSGTLAPHRRKTSMSGSKGPRRNNLPLMIAAVSLTALSILSLTPIGRSILGIINTSVSGATDNKPSAAEQIGGTIGPTKTPIATFRPTIPPKISPTLTKEAIPTIEPPREYRIFIGLDGSEIKLAVLPDVRLACKEGYFVKDKNGVKQPYVDLLTFADENQGVLYMKLVRGLSMTGDEKDRFAESEPEVFREKARGTIEIDWNLSYENFRSGDIEVVFQDGSKKKIGIVTRPFEVEVNGEIKYFLSVNAFDRNKSSFAILIPMQGKYDSEMIRQKIIALLGSK